MSSVFRRGAARMRSIIENPAQRFARIARRPGGRRWANSQQQRRERHCPHCPQCPGGCWNTEDIYPKITKGRFDGLVIFRLKSADAAVTLLFVAKFTGWASRAGRHALDCHPSVAVTHTRERPRRPQKLQVPRQASQKASQSQALRSSEDSQPTRHPWPRSRCCTSSSSSFDSWSPARSDPPQPIWAVVPPLRAAAVAQGLIRAQQPRRGLLDWVLVPSSQGRRPVTGRVPARPRGCFAPSLRRGWTRAP